MSDIKTGTSCHNDDSCGDYLNVMVDEKTKTYTMFGKMWATRIPKGLLSISKSRAVDVTNASKIAKTAEKSKANIAMIVGDQCRCIDNWFYSL